jgi:hypothetical protein
MSQSFFALTACPAHAAPPDDLHIDWAASLAPAEHERMLTEAMALGDTLLDTLTAYAETRPETSYGLLLEALRYAQWCLEREMHEDAADA